MSDNRESKLNMMVMQSGLTNDICKPLFKESGLSNYTYIEITTQGSLMYLNNDTGYLDSLISHKIMSNIPEKVINPHVRKGFHLQAANCDYINCLFKKGINEINQDFNLGNFLFIINTVKRENNTVAQVSRFGTIAENLQINNFYINNIKRLVEFSHYFPQRMDSFIRKFDKIRYVDKSSDLIKQRILALNSRQIKVDNSANLSFYIPNENYIDGRKLVEITPKERQIIRLSLQGYTAEMIAKEICLSRRTVEKYFTQLKEKLDCRLKLHIIGKLHEVGVLELI